MSDYAQQRRIAVVLYDELSGRYTGDKYGPNAVLAAVELPPRDRWDKRDEETHRLLLDADYLGFEVHHKTGSDRWGLAVRLAAKVCAVIREAEDA